MNIAFDRHAKRRMKWRGISAEEIKVVLEKPDKIEKSYHDKMNAFKIMGRRKIRVTYKIEPNRIIVISVVDRNN